jgi:hypothetical protein
MRSTLTAIAAATLLAASIPVIAFGAGPTRRAEADVATTFRAQSSAALQSLEIVTSSPSSVSAGRAAISDLVVRLRPAGEGRLQTVLSLADGDRQGRGRVLFTAELLVVSNGRLIVEERALCGAWGSGASICRTECDGGAFAILRHETAGGRTLLLRLGEVDAAESGGVRLGACSDGTGPEVSLAPRRGQPTAEIALRPQ